MCSSQHVFVILGSTLGPLLFLMSINDLSLIKNSLVNLFADDANFTLSNKDAYSLQNDIKLKKVDNSMRINELSINDKKTNYVVLTKRNQIFALPLK